MTGTSSFWAFQLRTAWRNARGLPLPRRALQWLRFSRQLLARHHSATGSPVVGSAVPEQDKLTVIVLNHKRPQNIGHLVRYLLRAGFVGRVIVSNNSQAYAMADYVKVRDPRLVLIDQPEPSGVGISLELARDHPSRYYARIDDDIFLHPAQLQWVYWNLRAHGDRPHGIFGAAFAPERDPAEGWPFMHRRNSTMSIDILNGLFSFTREHLDEYFRLCGLLGITDQRSLMNGEDIVLSFSGDRRPLIHHVGNVWECASEADPGVALHQSRQHFYDERWRIYSALLAMKPLRETEHERQEARC